MSLPRIEIALRLRGRMVEIELTPLPPGSSGLPGWGFEDYQIRDSNNGSPLAWSLFETEIARVNDLVKMHTTSGHDPRFIDYYRRTL